MNEYFKESFNTHWYNIVLHCRFIHQDDNYHMVIKHEMIKRYGWWTTNISNQWSWRFLSNIHRTAATVRLFIQLHPSIVKPELLRGCEPDLWVTRIGVAQADAKAQTAKNTTTVIFLIILKFWILLLQSFGLFHLYWNTWMMKCSCLLLSFVFTDFINNFYEYRWKHIVAGGN